jgi:hypothetical protein
MLIQSLLRGLKTDLEGKKATFASPAVLVQLIEWADKILSE